MNERKYEFTDETIKVFGRILHRIKAVRNFGTVNGGDLGGFIEKEENLSHEGNCWVFGDARVSGNAKVSGYAQVFGNARVYGDAWVSGDARVCEGAKVSGDALISGDAVVSGNAQVFGDAHVSGDAKVFGNAVVSGNARVSGDAWVFGRAKVFGVAHISKTNDHIVIGPIGSRDDYTTFYKTKDGSIMVTCGCFNGSIDEFEKRVNETHGDNDHGKDYRSAVEFVKFKLRKEV